MSSSRGTMVKFAAFAAVMVLLTVFLFFIFSQYRTGSTNAYSAVFNDVSRLKTGQTVRVAGIRVGTVNSVSLRSDKKVLVKFDADRDVVLTSGTRAAVRYLNLVGDRYLELVDGPGSTRTLPAGAQIPVDRTAPALDLDLLLGGLKPVLSGLNPQDVNALSAALVQIFQGEGGTLDSLLSKTSSFSNTLADNDQTVQQLIDHLNTTVATLNKDGDKFSGALAAQRIVARSRHDRCRDQFPGQGNRLDSESADQRAAAAGRHGGAAEPVVDGAQRPEESNRHIAAKVAEQLPQTGAARFTRLLAPVLPVRDKSACLGSAVPDRGSARVQARSREVRGTRCLNTAEPA
jgi:virulence factor Mce-like protein